MTTSVNNLLRDYKNTNGNNVLLHEENRIMTHNELENHSNQFANYLLKMGVRKNDRIVIMMRLGIDTIIAIMGIIKIGAIYVPIDRSQPNRIVEEIVSDTDPKLIICDEIYLERFEDIQSTLIVYGKNLNFFKYLQEEDIPCGVNVLSKDLVYIAYTSGTTGKPKGVMISHENVMTFVNSVTKNKFYHNKGAKSLCRTPISFDPFLMELLPSMISGGQVYIQERDVSFRKFISYISNNGVTNFGCGPSMLFLMADNLRFLEKYDLSSLKEIYIGYEKCPVSVIKKLQAVYPAVRFINGYGTTETFASSTFYEIPTLSNETDIPIGTAIEDEQLMILNEELRESKVDEIGELVIRGSSLFNGYWNNLEETKRKLIINPLFPESNELVYLTGDLAKKNDKGQIFFVGRKDQQVKINGYRVELGEVQYIIERHENIKECCIIYYDGEIICYYNTYSGVQGCESDFKDYCSQKLPKYKTPAKWIYVKNFPRNSNGKVKKNVLLYEVKYEKTNRSVGK